MPESTVAVFLTATVPLLVLSITLATEGYRARQRRLTDERLSAVIAVMAAADKRRRQLGVLMAMTSRMGSAVIDVFALQQTPPEDVADALRRYAAILDEASDARARVSVLMPELLESTERLEDAHGALRRVVSGYQKDSQGIRQPIGDRQTAFLVCRDEAEQVAQVWADEAREELRISSSLVARLRRRLAR